MKPRSTTWFRKPEESIPVDELSQRLHKTISEVEGVFHGISDNLDLIDEKTKCLRHDCEILLDSAGGKNDSTQLLFKVAEMLEGPMAFLTSCLEHQKRNQELMLASQNNADDLLQMQNDMVSSLEPLKFMLVFFKIEASQLSEENRQTFHSVSEEISHLHVLVDETFQKNIKNLRNAREAIFNAEKESKKERAAQAKLVAEKQTEISDAIRTLKQQIEKNSRTSTDLSNSTHNFEQAIGKLVMSLQYEDIIRQRCESLLKIVTEKPKGLSQTAWRLVMATQIETAAEELRQSTEELDSGLNSIAVQAKELYRASTTMDQFEHITASADGMVQMLLESLESIRSMLTQSTLLSKHSREAILPVQNLTKELSAIVFEVSIKIQFIALNAQVRSIQVGEGSGLEVLAARTAEISAELRELGDSTAQQIQQLHTAIDELVKTIDLEWKGGSEQLAQIESQGPTLESELHNLRDKTFSSLEIIANLSEMVGGFTRQDAERLHKLTAQSQSLEQFAQTLRSQAHLETLSFKQRQTIELEVDSFLSETHGAMHTRVHNGSHKDAKNFDLGITEQLQSRATSSKSLTCDNIELF